MTSTLERNSYVPQEVGKITARTVVAGSKYATLGESRKVILSSPKVARHYIENPGVGFFTRTVAYYGLDDKGNEKNLWLEGPFELVGKNRHSIKYKTPQGNKIVDLREVVRSEQKFLELAQELSYIGIRIGYLDMPSTNRIVAYKDGDSWELWNTDPNSKEYNGGFARKTGSLEESRESLLQANVDGKLFPGLSREEVSKLSSMQCRKPDIGYGLVPVNGFSLWVSGPVYVYAGWYFDDFDYRDDGFGCLASGSEQKAESRMQELSANAEDKPMNYTFKMKPREYQKYLDSLRQGNVSDEFLQFFSNPKIK